MEFSLSDEQRMLRRLAAEVASKFDETYWQRIDEEACFPEEFWRVLAEQGALGIAIPEEYGGSGLGLLDMVMFCEAVAEHGGGVEGGGLPIAGPVFGGFLVTRHGSPAQKERYLPGIVHGEMWAGAFTEPEGGSNVSSVSTVAETDGEAYVISGQKTFISQVARARHMVILVRTDPPTGGQRSRGLSLLAADLPDAAIQAQPLKKMGCHYMDTNLVFIERARIPRMNLIGEQGEGWRPLFDVLNPERIVLAAVAVGTGMLALRKATEFATHRKVWGDRPIGAHQGIQFPLATARMYLAAARLKVYEAAWLYDRQSPECGVAATMAKYLAAHAALEAADRAIQTLGGAGYIVESGVERHWRNLRLNRIAPVTDEMALNYVARHDLGLPRSY